MLMLGRLSKLNFLSLNRIFGILWQILSCHSPLCLRQYLYNLLKINSVLT